MFSSLKIARIFGIDLFIHWTFWLLPLWVIVTWNNSPQIMPLWMNILVIAALFACVVLHELGHAVMARHFGIRTRRITLSPLGGIAQLERMSHHPWEEFCIAIAGPLVNVLIAAGLGVVLGGAFIVSSSMAETRLWEFGVILWFLNVFMVLFNLLPAFPMDGGRILRATLASSMGLLKGTRIAVNVGTVVALLMGAAGAFMLHNPFVLLIALFVIWAGHQELAMLESEERQRHAHEQETIPAILLSPRPAAPWKRSRVVVHVWDPSRGEWVRQAGGDHGFGG